MAKIAPTYFLGDLGTLKFQYTPDDMHTLMDLSNDRRAVYLDEDGGQKLILKGENFAYLDGDLLQGSVHKIIFKDNDGNTTEVVSGVDFKAKQLDDLLTNGSNLGEFIEKIQSGKDTYNGTALADLAWAGKGGDRIFGRGGDDSINGEGGNDRMTGGAGSDHFFFMLDGKGGTDVITDFDAVGGGTNQDYIGADFDDVLSIKQVGDDVVLDFGGGNTLRLLDTDKSDIGKADFDMPI